LGHEFEFEIFDNTGIHNSKSEFNVGNLPRLTIPQKETKEGAFPESKSHGKVFIFRGSSDQKLYSGF